MSSRKRRQFVRALGWFLAPIVLVKGAVMVLDRPAPQLAGADVNVPDATLATAPSAKSSAWTDAARAADQRARDLAQRPLEVPPLYYPPAPVQIVEVPTDPLPSPPDQISPEPVVITLSATVQMIMKSETEEIALVDGRPYRAGESLRSGGWMVERINSRDRAVVFRHLESGKVEVRYVPITD